MQELPKIRAMFQLPSARDIPIHWAYTDQKIMLENVCVTSYKDYLDMFADLKQNSKDSPPDLAIQIVWERKKKKEGCGGVWILSSWQWPQWSNWQLPSLPGCPGLSGMLILTQIFALTSFSSMNQILLPQPGAVRWGFLTTARAAAYSRQGTLT